MRDHRRDASFDFATVLIELSKAIEVQVNDIVASTLSHAPVPVRSGNVDGRSVDFSASRAQSVGQLSRVIAGDRERMTYLATHLSEGRWFTEQLPPILEELAPFRNEAAHSVRRTREEVLPVRDRILGVGGEGILPALTRVVPK